MARTGRMRNSSQQPTPELTMAEIIALLSGLSRHLPPRTLNQLTLVVEAVLAMTGRVTRLGLSRWTEKGGSDRTVPRFFKAKLDWPVLRWQRIKRPATASEGVWLLAGDEVMVTKSGKETHGLGVFFFDVPQAAARPVLFEPVAAGDWNPHVLSFDHRAAGARSSQ